MENIQVLIDRETNSTLRSDHDFFNTKSLNALVNRIVHNSIPDFLEENKKLSESIKMEFTDHIKNDELSNNITSHILGNLLKNSDDSMEKEVKLNIYVIKAPYQPSFLKLKSYIENDKTIDIGLNKVIRILLKRYSKLSRANREILAHKESYDIIRNAGKEFQISIHTKANKNIILNPYDFFNPLDHESIFLFGTDEHGAIKTIRLSNIKDEPIPTTIKAFIPKVITLQFEKVRLSTLSLKGLSRTIDTDNIIPLLFHLDNTLSEIHMLESGENINRAETKSTLLTKLLDL